MPMMTVKGKERPRVEITPRLGAITRTRYHYRFPGLSPEVAFRVPDNNLINLERAVLERVFYVKNADGTFSAPPKPQPGVFEQRTAPFLEALKGHLSPTIPITHEEFVGLYKDRRKKIYDNARLSLVDQPLTKKDARCKSFVKADKMNITEKPDPAARLIQPRSPRFNIVVGCYLKPIEHRVYRAINKVYGYPTIMKGYNSDQTGKVISAKWRSFHKPVGITIDAKRFDQHVHDKALDLAHQVYLHLYKNFVKELKELLDYDYTTEGVCYLQEAVLKYWHDAQRISGSMDTAMGNIIVMTGMLHPYLTAKKIKFQVVNNGDDSTIFVEAKDAHKLDDLQQYFHELGFTMKIENIARELEHVVFCQTRPVLCTHRNQDGKLVDTYRMIRDPHTCLAKDTTCIFSFESPTSLGKYCTVFGEGGLSLSSGIPILQEFYKMFKRVPCPQRGKVTFETGMAHNCVDMISEEREITPQCRYSFWLAFGILPDEQIAYENFYRSSNITWDGLRVSNRQQFPLWPPNVSV